MENVPWDVEFDGTAKKSGVLRIGITVAIDINPPGTRGLSFPIFVTRDMTPEQKAQAIVSAIQSAAPGQFEIEFDAPDDDFKIKVRNPDANARYIAAISFNDQATGEDIKGVKDAPGEEEMLMVAYFSVGGKGRDEDGAARIQLGKDFPLISVPTFERAGSEILKHLISNFNEVYSRLGFKAEEICGVPGMAIEKVPCPRGIRAGTTDTGLVIEMGLLDPSIL